MISIQFHEKLNFCKSIYIKQLLYDILCYPLLLYIDLICFSGHEVAVIYGSLPPNTKLAQAAKFNDPNNSCKIMVATDAIGMGLNL